jgi:hypothetical protein
MFVLILILAPFAIAKSTVDFDPNLDFSKFKTFAYIGGKNMLEIGPFNPIASRTMSCGSREGFDRAGERGKARSTAGPYRQVLAE